MSIDTLLNGIGKGKSKLGYLLKNALTEGSEEMTSSAVNWLADVMISKDKSEWEEILLYYRAMGFSEDVAFMEALKEQGRQMLKEGAAGAITGVAAAGGRLAFGQISEGIQNHRNYQEAVQNGKQYYALNQLSQGDLARSLGNMNMEQAYRTMSPEAMMEASGLNPRQAQYLLENTEYSPEGRAARPSANQVYSMLRATGLNHQEPQALMKSKGYSLKDAPQLPNLIRNSGGEQLYRDETSERNEVFGSPEMLFDQQKSLLSGDSEESFTNGLQDSIMQTRNMAMGLRKPAGHVLTEQEIDGVISDAVALKIDPKLLLFNTGGRTGLVDDLGMIGVCGDILPDLDSKIARDRMSQRAVLAHEYYGHWLHHPSEYPIGDWRDEFRASYEAAIKAPALTAEDRALLMIDAYDRAREAGKMMEYDETARRIIYGY